MPYLSPLLRIPSSTNAYLQEQILVGRQWQTAYCHLASSKQNTDRYQVFRTRYMLCDSATSSRIARNYFSFLHTQYETGIL